MTRVPPEPPPDGNQQLRLDERTRAGDRPTARSAALGLDGRTIGRQIANAAVVVASTAGGAICAEVAAKLNRDRGCVARRLTDAERRGLIRDTGRTRKSKASGRDQIVWAPTDAGLRLAAQRIAEAS